VHKIKERGKEEEEDIIYVSPPTHPLFFSVWKRAKCFGIFKTNKQNAKKNATYSVFGTHFENKSSQNVQVLIFKK